jgi:hypothetical protein
MNPSRGGSPAAKFTPRRVKLIVTGERHTNRSGTEGEKYICPECHALFWFPKA